MCGLPILTEGIINNGLFPFQSVPHCALQIALFSVHSHHSVLRWSCCYRVQAKVKETIPQSPSLSVPTLQILSWHRKLNKIRERKTTTQSLMMTPSIVLLGKSCQLQFLNLVENLWTFGSLPNKGFNIHLCRARTDELHRSISKEKLKRISDEELQAHLQHY